MILGESGCGAIPKLVNQHPVFRTTRWGPGPMRSGTWGSPALPAPVQPNPKAPQMVAVHADQVMQPLGYTMYHHVMQLFFSETGPFAAPPSLWKHTLLTMQSHWPRWHQLPMSNSIHGFILGYGQQWSASNGLSWSASNDQEWLIHRG